MPIEYLNGRRLKHAITAGAESVITRKEYLNKINVFPVADGDTGTNMALTLKAIADGLYDCDDSTVDAVVCCAADSALVGSRGNSGSILAQFYQGMYEGLAGKERITTKEFGSALMLAKDFAYDSMMDPKEGTILTVIRDWTDSVERHSKNSSDFKHVLHGSVNEAKVTLAKTPDMLIVNGVAVLKKAGVVDSGAQGFVDMVDGVQNFIQRGSVKDFFKRKFFNFSEESNGAKVDANAEDITFQFCTEFVIENGVNYEKKKMRKALIEYGDSLIIGGSSTKTKVHIHTNEPEKIFEIAESYGILKKKKFEDMRAQNEAAFGRKRIGIVTDSTCDLSDEYLEKNDIMIAPLTLHFGDEEFLDRVTMNTSEFYERLKTSKDFPKTSQPSTAIFRQVYDDALRRYDGVISIHLTSGASGTYQNAKMSSKFFKDRTIITIDSKMASLGIGFLIREAVKLRDAGESIEAIAKRLNEMVPKLRAIISLETIDNLVRGGRLSKSRGAFAKLLRINPVFSIDEYGKVVQIARGIGTKGSLDKAISIVVDYVGEKKSVQLGVVYSDDRSRAEYAKEKLLAARHDLQIEVSQISPVLGVHGGRGTVALLVFAE